MGCGARRSREASTRPFPPNGEGREEGSVRLNAVRVMPGLAC